MKDGEFFFFLVGIFAHMQMHTPYYRGERVGWSLKAKHCGMAARVAYIYSDLASVRL